MNPFRLGLLFAIALGPACVCAKGPGEYLGAIEVAEPLGYFGGFSGLRFDPTGRSFVVLSDSAALFTGRVDRDAQGAILAVHFDSGPALLLDPAGLPLEFPFDDAEGLEVAPDGSLLISFEIRQRVSRHAADGRAQGHFPVPSTFVGYEPNAGLESVAMAANGSVYTMPEGDASGTVSIPFYRYRAGGWERVPDLPGDHAWRPVDADFGPDGKLYVLERDYWGLIGFMSRLRRFQLGGSGAGGGEVLFATPAGRHGNLEGLSVWRAEDGRLHATLVSDNNFLPRVPTEFVDYALPD